MQRIHRKRRLPKTILCASAALISASAQAQSSVTLYGVVDVNIEYVSNFSSTTPTAANRFAQGPAHDVVRMSSGGLSGSRFGVRGIEDLGGGLKAVFTLENGFTADDGKLGFNGRMFGRQASVGLASSDYGRITFGRQTSSIYDGLANFTAALYTNQYEPGGAIGGFSSRSDNTAKYAGQFGGLTAIAHWSFGNGIFGAGETPGQFRRDSGYGAALNYQSGRYGIGIAYDQYNPSLAASNDVGSFKRAGIGASYTAGPVKLVAGYRWGMDKTGSGATLWHDNLFWTGVNYQATAALGFTLAYYYDDISLANISLGRLPAMRPRNPWQILFIADYSLSKTTDIYLTSAYAKNAGLNFDTSATGFVNGYFLGSGKNDMLGVAVGIRKKF
jgi:predicted porin